MKTVGRREFFKYSAGLLGLCLLGKFGAPVISGHAAKALGLGEAVAEQKNEKATLIDGFDAPIDELNKFVMIIDVGACVGCRTCMWGCKAENNIPDTISPLWIEVFEMQQSLGLTGHPSLKDLKTGAITSYTQSPLEGKWYLPVQCNHCSNPSCVKVCPTGATFKAKDGLVQMDYDKCIGCRSCVVACPYSARRFNWFKPVLPPGDVNKSVIVRPLGVVEKCTFCAHRVRRGKLPRCVEVCPPHARHFGNLNDPESEVSKLLKSNQGFHLLEELNNQPNIWYITRGKRWL